MERETRSVLHQDKGEGMWRIALAFIIAAIIAGCFLYQSAEAVCIGAVRIGEPQIVICDMVWIPGVEYAPDSR